MLNLFFIIKCDETTAQVYFAKHYYLYCYKSIRSTDLFADGNHRGNHRGSFNEQCMWAVMPHLSKL